MIFPHHTSRRVVLRPAGRSEQSDVKASVLRAGFGQGGQEARSGDTTAAYAAFLVRHRTDDDVLGFGTLYDLDEAGHIRLRVVLDPKRSKLGVGAEAVFLLINYAFATLPIDKVITQTTQASFGALGLGPDDNPVYEPLADHVYFRGRLWDLHYFEVRRPHWDNYIDTKLAGFLPPGMNWRTAPHPALAAARR